MALSKALCFVMEWIKYLYEIHSPDDCNDLKKNTDEWW